MLGLEGLCRHVIAIYLVLMNAIHISEIVCIFILSFAVVELARSLDLRIGFVIFQIDAQLPGQGNVVERH